MSHRSLRCTTLLLLALVATAPARGQLARDELVIATHVSGNPATQLLQVNANSGAIQQLNRFGSDSMPPLALAVDPINFDVVLAVDRGIGARIVRVSTIGSASSERLLADTTLPINDLEIAGDGDIYMTAGGPAGGLYAIPRNGGALRPVASLPRASAIAPHPSLASHLLVAQSGEVGPPVVDPGIAQVDLISRVVTTWTYPSHRPLDISCVLDLPTGLPRQVLGHADGSVAISSGFGPPAQVFVTPRLPAAGLVAAVADASGSRLLFLGGAPHPFIKTFDPLAATPTWSVIAGPLPGDPVDFDLVPDVVPQLVYFGATCSSLQLDAVTGGTPRLGNAQFAIDLRGGVVNRLAFLAVGASDQSVGGVPLPWTLPLGCDLLVSLQLVFPHVVDGAGRASQRLPIPNYPALSGGVVFAQWLQDQGVPFAASRGAAVQIGR